LGFQQKCIEKIHDIQQKGHTIIFVSHFPAEMANLCNQALLLEQGEIIDRGSAKQVAEKYKKLFELNHD
jgi:ABC-type polysaccharide/polyol phosphate transport system ATPase subunit